MLFGQEGPTLAEIGFHPTNVVLKPRPLVIPQFASFHERTDLAYQLLYLTQRAGRCDDRVLGQVETVGIECSI
jgi:hypothetical protein